MSNPTTLQELADSLAAQARYAEQRCREYDQAGNNVQRANQAGYANALLDTRATVLAMILEQRTGQKVSLMIIGGPVSDHDVESMLGTLVIDHEAGEHAVPYDDCPLCNPEARRNFHKAAPDDNSTSYSMCAVCGKEVKVVPGGNGPTWVHEDTGMVVGDGPETNPNVVILSELTATIQRKRDGIDCTEDESALIKRYLRACEGSDDAVVALFPLEWAEVCAE